MGTDGKPVDATSAAVDDPERRHGHAPEGLADRARSCSSPAASARSRRRPTAPTSAGAAGIILVDNRFGEANAIPVQLADPGGHGRRPRRCATSAPTWRRTAARRRSASSSGIQEIQTGPSGVIASFSSAGPTDFGCDAEAGHRRTGPRRPLVDAAADDRLDLLGLRRHVDGDAARRRAPRHCSSQQHPRWAPWQVKSALMSTAGPAWQNTARTQEATVLLEGAGLANVARRERPEDLHRPAVAVVREGRRRRRRQRKAMLLSVSDAGGGAGTGTSRSSRRSRRLGVADRRAGDRRRRARRRLRPSRSS